MIEFFFYYSYFYFVVVVGGAGAAAAADKGIPVLLTSPGAHERAHKWPK